MKRATQYNRIVSRTAALALLGVSSVAIDRAQAQNACAPATPANGDTVTCSGTVTNQNGNLGFNSDPATGVTINVQTGATVSGTAAGINTTNGAIGNQGAITGQSIGVQGNGTLTLTNSGTITGTTNIGIVGGGAGSSANITNSGSITGANSGIFAGLLGTGTSLVLTNSGTVSAGGTTIDFDTVGVTNSGTIESTNANGIAIKATESVTISNGDGSGNGIIRADGQAGIAIQGKTITVTGNTGTIEGGIGVGNTAGVAIDASAAGGTADVTTSGLIQARTVAIVTDGLLTLKNLGTGQVNSGGVSAVRSFNGDVSVNQNLAPGTTTGTISAIAPGGIAISAAGNATVANIGDGNTTGIISGNKSAISAAGIATITANSGLIEAIGDNGRAIDASTANVTTSGTIRANGAGGVAVFGINSVNVTNTNTIQATAGTGVFSLNGPLTVNNSGIITGLLAAATSNDGILSVTNSGTMEATGANGAAIGGVSVTVNNSGTVRAAGSNGFAIQSFSAGASTDVTNTDSGIITADRFAIVSVNPLNVDNSGQISSTGSVGVAIESDAQSANSLATIKNSATGRITASAAGLNAIRSQFGAVNVTNAGLIESLAQNQVAIIARTDATVSNAGTIRNAQNGGIAIEASTTTVTNLANGLITGQAGGILGGTVVVKGNDGTIEAANIPGVTNATNGIAIMAGGTADITNSKLIQATESGGIAIKAGVGATIDNAATGTISGTAFAIEAGNVNVKSNAGTIVSDGIGGIAIGAVNATITNSGTIEAVNGRAIETGVAGAATIVNQSAGTITGLSGIFAETFDITNAGTIKGNATVAINGSGIVRNAGLIQGGTASVQFNGGAGVTNQLILQTGSQLIGDAVGSTAGAANKLELQGHGTAGNNFLNFNTLDVNADTAWVWNSTAVIGPCATAVCTNINSGALAVDGTLTSGVSVNAGGTLAGRGTVTGDVSAAGAVAPGAVTPFSTLTVNGNVTFNSGSIYRVNVNATGQNDKLLTTTATLTGATVNALTQGGVMLGTPYTILTANGGLGGTQFAGVTASSAFLTPTLTYDANNVFLTFAGAGPNGTAGFVTAAQTRNQLAVASALDASPTSNSLIGRLLSLTVGQARAAFDALSGEIFGSVQNTQGQEASFTRGGILGRLRQASYADAPGELGALGFAGPELAYADGRGAYASPDGKTANGNGGRLAYADDANGAMAADMPMKNFPAKAPRGQNVGGRDLTFWAQGLGGWGHSDSDGNAASLKSRFGGFLSGADMRFGQVWRAGIVAGYTRSDLKADARASSAGIDSVTFGLYAGGRLGAFNLRTGASFSYDSIDTSRAIVFPGFSDQTKAHFHGEVGQVFGEVGYGIGLGTFALEPFAGLAYVHINDGSFQESGGLAALTGSSAREDTGYSSLGLRAATFMPLGNGTVLVPRASAQWQHAFGDVTPASALAFQSTGTAFTVAGIPIARDSALVEAGLDWRITPWTKLGAFYQGELAAHAQSHAVKGGFTLDF